LDILAFRIITTNVGDCYNALGVIHAHYTPLIKKIKDYIAVPKFNGYQSIHTTILGMFAFPVEIQIRTKEMEEVAEYGVAAHASYYEHGGSVMVSERQAAWIKKMQDIVNSYQTGQRNEEFSHELDVEVLEKNIFVYTPKGDVVELPRGSTVLDFAFRVHSDVGLRFKNALINGIIKPINTTLKTGDIIEIVTYKNKYTATKHWMEFLITPTAKAKLQKFVNDQQRAILKQFAIEEYNKKADDFQVPHL
jgi:(p)ppGpp synthase/HD superfamily hydrolase